MYIEAVIISVSYSDFLCQTLQSNKNVFDRLVVVTDTKDTKTKNICEAMFVECLQTDVFYENGDKFNKAKGINAGLAVLSKKDWVVHLDADIYLPPMFKHIMGNILPDLPKDHIYGIDRLMVRSYDEWINYLENPKPMHEGWCYVHTDMFPLGTRVAEYMNKGWNPIGYFQMWNPNASNVFTYPDQHDGADRTDVLFAKNWPRNKKQLIPEIIGLHLDSENVLLGADGMGKNWNGRKTIPFTKNGLQEAKDKQSNSLINTIEENRTKTLENLNKIKELYDIIPGHKQEIIEYYKDKNSEYFSNINPEQNSTYPKELLNKNILYINIPWYKKLNNNFKLLVYNIRNYFINIYNKIFKN